MIEEQTERAVIQYDNMFGFAITAETSHEQRLEIGRVIGQFTGPSVPMDEAFDSTVVVVGVLYHPAQFKAHSGEWRQGTRVVFLLDTGSRLSSFSEAILRFAESQLIPLFGQDTSRSEKGCICMLTGPVPVHLARQKTKSGGPTYAPQLV